jgi:signal transduction histidine kinase
MIPLMKKPTPDHTYTSPAGLQIPDPGNTNLYALINDANMDQCLVLDTELRIISWNRACELVTGIGRELAIGKQYHEINESAVIAPAIAEALDLALQGFQSFVPWEKASHSGGYYEQHFIPLRDDSNAVFGILNIIHDVAHRIKAEQELKRLNKTLSHKNKELKHRGEELASFNWIASHDLKEPLRKIYFFIEMVATKEGNKLSDTARSNLRRAQSAVQRMGLLTDDIVTFSEAVAPTESLAMVSLQELHNNALELHKKTIEDSAAIIETSALPTITGYPQMLQHLWNHLLGNAIKFHQEGARPEVVISSEEVAGDRLETLDADHNATYYCLSFKDNGIGIAPEFQEKIFGMFQRLHPQGTYRGTGMGLPICQKVAEAHGGFIQVESVEGEGSVFRCYLEKQG